MKNNLQEEMGFTTMPTVALELWGVFPGDPTVAGGHGKGDDTTTTTTTVSAIPKPRKDIEREIRDLDLASSLDELLRERARLVA